MHAESHLHPAVLDGHRALEDGVVAREVIQMAAQLVHLCFPKTLQRRHNAVRKRSTSPISPRKQCGITTGRNYARVVPGLVVQEAAATESRHAMNYMPRTE